MVTKHYKFVGWREIMEKALNFIKILIVGIAAIAGYVGE